MTATEQALAVPTVPLDQIRAHPANPRINAVADDELVESVRAQGVLDPVMVAPAEDGDGWILIDGHRRWSAAGKAGLTSIGINPRYDLVTEAQQIEVMVVTGLQKELLSPVEEAAGYEQLALLGMDEAAIAAATGFGVRRVADRLKLNAFPAQVRAKVHAGEATLVDVAALVEFADDPAATAELEEALGTPNFVQQVYAARRRRDLTIRRAEKAAEFEALGARLAVSVPGASGLVEIDGEEHRAYGMHNFDTDELRGPDGHDGCLAYCVPEYEYSDPYLVCVDYAKHPRQVPPAKPSQAQSEWEAQQAVREERRIQREAARDARVGWLAEHFTTMFPPRTHGTLVAAARAGLPFLVIDDREAIESGILLTALGLTPENDSYAAEASAKASYASGLAQAKAPEVLAGFARYLAALIADLLRVGEEPQFLDDVEPVQYALGVWDWLKSAGYPLSDFDKAERTALEVRHTELTTEAEAS